MAILDAGPYQEWTAAFDDWERAKRRYDAAHALQNSGLTEHLRQRLEEAQRKYHAGIKAIKA